MEIYLIGLAVALVGGLLMSRLTRLLHLPAVTAYLVAGLLLGPFFLGRLNVPGLGFNTLEEVNVLSIVSQTALGFIAFAMGNEFRLSQLRTIGSRAIIIGILQAVITTIVWMSYFCCCICSSPTSFPSPAPSPWAPLPPPLPLPPR